MTTDDYIKTLRNKRKEPESVAMRQALVYSCYNKHIPVTILAQIFKKSRTLIYKYIYRVRDLLDVNDRIIKAALKEVDEHHLLIQPYSIQGEMIFIHAGYKLTIDNKIF